MGKNQQIIKLFIVIFVSTALIFSFSHFGAKAFEKITNVDGKYSVGTTIGPLDVSGKTKGEAISMLEEKYVDWLKNTSIELKYGEITSPLDLNHFHLDSKQTIDSLKEGQKSPVSIIVTKSQVKEQLQILFPQLETSTFDLEKLTTSLNTQASLFESGEQSFNLYNDFLLTNQTKKDTIISDAIVTMKEVPDDLATIIENNPTIEIKEESTFSLLDFAKKHKVGDSSSLNIIATGIYQAILPSDFSIVERNISSSLPDYAPLGFEAKVNQNEQVDFVIANPKKAKYFLELQLENDKLRVILKGEEFLNNYKINKKDEQSLKPKTIVQYSPQLLPGKTKIQAKGADGQIVKVYREIYQGNQFIKSELISEDYYPPIYQVIVQALARYEQGTPQTSDTSGSIVDTENNSQSNDDSNSIGNKTSTNSDEVQQDDSNLWGKPNEQPK
ncbi:G5 domain-containing protein [Neobacillus novalis]|uniref:G5 domain-containing protein n=1 Tax=Neobacillus novalis TaxID=220687 RepID=A0AA95S7K1_9BACI|nr:G5 domain-containing protein [Neobacillus novalis]WHY84885.1 G5 domain-containing protein [Neobacillus novalis]